MRIQEPVHCNQYSNTIWFDHIRYETVPLSYCPSYIILNVIMEDPHHNPEIRADIFVRQ